MAADAERKIAEGDWPAITSLFTSVGALANIMGGRVSSRANPVLTIWRDRQTEMLNAFVVEKVLLPPKGIGKPVIRRALVAWPEKYEFAMVAISEQHPGLVQTDSMWGYRDFSLGLDPRAFLRIHFGNPEWTWMPQSGEVLISDPIPDRPCKTDRTDHDLDGVFHPTEQDVTCELALYEVRLEGEFLRHSDMRSPVARAIAPRHNLTVASQRVPGIRFVTQCTEPPRGPPPPPKPPGFPNPCWHHWEIFWRDNALFAPELGVDVTAMTLAGSGRYLRELPGIPVDSSNRRAFLWTLHRPDGTLVDQGQALPDREGGVCVYENGASPRSVMVTTWWCGVASRRGRVQVLVPETDYDPTASRYSMLVLHVDLPAVP